MEKLEAPQTHLGLKAMIKEVDEDFDGKISYREVQTVADTYYQKLYYTLTGPTHKHAERILTKIDGLRKLAELSEINVSEEGVSGAKDFFEAKVNKIGDSNRFEQDIKKEQEEKKKAIEEKKQRQAAFEEKAKLFQ